MLSLVPLAAGSASVLGAAPGEASREIGYLPQRRSFDTSVRIRGVDVVRLGLDGDHWGLPMPWGTKAKAARDRVNRAIEVVGPEAAHEVFVANFGNRVRPDGRVHQDNHYQYAVGRATS